MANNLTLAYQPKEFFALGARIASWCTDEDIYNSLPSEESHNGRVYLHSGFGSCPSDNGVSLYFAWDDHNAEFLLWETEGPNWCWGKDSSENLDMIEPIRFSSLDDLEKYIRTGE